MNKINYQTATETELRNHFDVVIRNNFDVFKSYRDLSNNNISEFIGAYIGVCYGRGLKHSFEQVQLWKKNFLYKIS